ncbi:MAG: hypothetical protein LUG19_07390, partial [Desulfovibrio sp.]|uniref:hypothetical protein n=1 Tax=Desulfovibrio sp. TaxID=885 RepID=UPI00258BBA9C
MAFSVLSRKIARAVVCCLLLTGLCGFFFDPGPDKLFEEACKTLPITGQPNLKSKAVVDKFLNAYGPAAKAGHVEAMLFCQFLLENSGQSQRLYPYLQPLDSLKPGDLKVSRKNFARLGLKDFPFPDEDVLNVMFSSLCKLHLVGCGTEQSYAKARAANAKVTKDGLGFASLRLKDAFFADPDTKEAQEAFWQFTRDMPGAELFLVNRIALGDSFANV